MAKARSADRQRYWREVIEHQHASGQRIVGFCSKEGLAPASFRCCRIAGWPPILSTGLSSGKKNPAKLRPVAVGSGLHVGLLSPNRRC